MKRTTCLLCLCWAVAGVTADAAVVQWLYTAEVPVRSQSAGERARAASGALAELLTRLTGLSPLPVDPMLTAALSAPDRFYARYEYGRGERSAGTNADATPQLRLVFHFDPSSVLRLLREAGLPVWAADRPSVLAWIVLEQGGERRLIAETDPVGGAVADGLRRRARARGLELAVPLMDLRDSALSPAAAWGLFWEDINAASARYAPDLVLVGRIRQQDGSGWRSVWDLRAQGAAAPLRLYDLPVAGPRTQRILAGETLFDAFRRSGPTPAALAAAAVDTVASTLAQRFAVHGQLGAIDAVVRNAQTPGRYAALMAYLQSREYIERVDVVAVRPDAIGLRLHSRSSPAQLGELLGMGSALAPTVDAAPEADRLQLVWQGAP